MLKSIRALRLASPAFLFVMFAASASCRVIESGDHPGTAGLQLNLNPQLGDFVLYAERSITIGAHSQVVGGDVGVVALVAPASSAQLSVADHAQVSVAHNLLAPSISLSSADQVGDVQTNTLTNAGAGVGQLGPFPATMPAMPLAALAGSLGADVTVGAHQQSTLSPGAYGALNVGEHAEVTLGAGTYSFASVTIADHVQIVGAAAGVNLIVSGTLSLAASVQLYPASNGSADRFVISVAGVDVGAQAAVSFGQEVQLTALVVAPNGTVNVGSHVQLTGAAAAFDVLLGDHSQVTFQAGFAAAPSVNPPPGTQQLSGYFGNPVDGAFPLAGPVPPDQAIQLAVGLPFRDPAGMRAYVDQVSDPRSPTYRKFKGLDELHQTYGATQTDYDAVAAWATAAGLTVVRTYPSRLLLDVSGTVADVEQALHTNLVYRYREDGSSTRFLTVDREPSVDLATSLLWIGGLTQYMVPVPAKCRGCLAATCCPSGSDAAIDAGFFNPTAQTSQGDGVYGANDLRMAFLQDASGACTALRGAGQTIGLLELEGFDTNDVLLYDQLNGPTLSASNAANVQVLEGSNPGGSGATGEAILDIEMVQALAPDARVAIFFSSSSPFQGGGGIAFSGGPQEDAFWAMDVPDPNDATRPLLSTVSSSWFVEASPNTQLALEFLAGAGVSIFFASGDYGAQGDPLDNRNMDYQTLVGGTFLLSNQSGSPVFYEGEATWNGGCPFGGDLILTSNSIVTDLV